MDFKRTAIIKVADAGTRQYSRAKARHIGLLHRKKASSFLGNLAIHKKWRLILLNGGLVNDDFFHIARVG